MFDDYKKIAKSLRWLSNQIPSDDFLTTSNEDNILRCIREYSLNGAQAIDNLLDIVSLFPYSILKRDK